MTEERFGGIAMLLAIGLGMLSANSSLSELYAVIHHYPLRLGIAPLIVEAPLIDWINQGLLVIFFFHIGLHTKREMTSGVLSSPARAALPAAAALGGMAAPALIYLTLNYGDPEALRGWGVPIATDVVLVLGLMSFFGASVSPGMLAFITAVAIFDDLGAVVVIALFYGEIEFGLPLAAIAAGLGGLAALNWRASGTASLYLFAGVLLWAGLVGSGLEGAIAGAITGLALPTGAFPADRAERRLAPLSLFVVVPAFAFFNAGIPLNGVHADWYADPIAYGIILALIIGKPIGIMTGTYGAVLLRIGSLPAGANGKDAVSAALFAGVGFTMSLFIVTASFDDPARADAAKLAVLVGSAASAFLAVLGLVVANRRRAS